MKNLKLNKKAISIALATTISLSMTGCGNRNVFDTKYTFNKAIIFGDDTATIIEIDKWKDYDGEQLQITTKDGLVIVTSSFDTKLVNDKKSEIKAEDIARSIKGEDVEIIYLDDVPKQKQK